MVREVFSSVFPPLKVLVCISSLFWERFGQWRGNNGGFGWSCILIFFSAGGGPGFDFVEFLLKERGRKRGDFVMGSCWWCDGVHTIGKERGGLD